MHHQEENLIVKSQLTLIDAFNQFWTVCGNDDRRALSCAGLTYFYLCRVWNATGRSISFRRQNALICAELYISKPTLEKHRNVLKQVGLIDFFTKGKGDPNITYKILDPGIRQKEVKKVNDFTSPVSTNDSSTNGIIRAPVLFIVVGGETINYDYLLQFFEKDAGLQKNYSQNRLPSGKFRDAVEQWMIRNNGNQYNDLKDARKHFFFWMPHYQEISKSYLKTIPTVGKNANRATGRHSSSDYAGGL